MIKPPNIPDEILFRNMLELPRPSKRIDFRLNQAKEIPLIIKAISSFELSQLSKKDLDSEIMIKCLFLINNKQAFSSIEKIKSIITVAEYQILLDQISKTLNEISPTFISCDYDSWFQKLKRGANHFSNWLTTHSLGNCFSLTVIGDKVLTFDHPEQYFGVPRNQLLDCHWMAYFAAKQIFQERNS